MTGSTADLYKAAVALHMQGRIAEAERAYAAVLQQEPTHTAALHDLGVLYLRSARHDLAIAFLRKAGSSATVRNNLAVALCAAHRFAEAAEVCHEVLKAEPGSIPTLVNLGAILNQLGQHAEARPVLQRAVELAPDHARAHNLLAQALVACRDVQPALQHFEQAVALAPNQADLQADLAAMLLKLGRAEEAEACYRRALALAPDAPALLCGLGETLGARGRHEEAVASFRRALTLAPDFAAAQHNLGTALTYLGRMTEAKAAFSRAVDLAPGNSAYQRAMLGTAKITPDDPHLKALEAMVVAGRLDPGETIAAHFALAKAYDDLADYGRAFAALQKANAAKRAVSSYDIRTDLERFRAIAAAFTAEFLDTHAGAGADRDVPVFIVGMPRSGTSLVEQIIASHPDVFGAGEQGLMPDLVNLGRAGASFPSGVAGLTAAELKAFGKAYAEKLCALAPRARRITDKLPLNFQLIGLIRLALPKARIIHVMRDPLDTCFSCYSVLFDDDLDFSLDLADLGRYHRGYTTLMEHWRAVLPPGAMLEIQYEDLVANLESEARKLIGYCGLEWDDRCLRFHETKRPVQTASAHQVRQPLYRTSVGRAHHYAQWLKPLRRALDGGAD